MCVATDLIGIYVCILTGSKTQASAEYDAPATTPAPPTKPHAILSTMLPYKFGVTITSN